MLEESGCPVRELIGHIVKKLEQSGFKDNTFAGGRTANSALQVAV
jgi:hypothetical protein